MFELLIQNKLLVMIGLSQFGLVLMMFIIINLSQRWLGKSSMSNNSLNPNPKPTPSAAIATSRLNAILKPRNNLEGDASSIRNIHELNTSISIDLPELITDMQNETGDRPDANPESDMYKVAISPDLFTELLEISNNPAETVDEAIRWWLRRRTLNALETSIDRRDRLSSRSYSSKRSQQELWND
jgi:hypothetical protein